MIFNFFNILIIFVYSIIFNKIVNKILTTIFYFLFSNLFINNINEKTQMTTFV